MRPNRGDNKVINTYMAWVVLDCLTQTLLTVGLVDFVPSLPLNGLPNHLVYSGTMPTTPPSWIAQSCHVIVLTLGCRMGPTNWRTGIGGPRRNGGPHSQRFHRSVRSMFTSFVVCASDHKYCRLLLLLCCTNNSKCNTGWYYLYLLNSINKMLGLTN